MRILSFLNLKGGPGKTTLAVNTAYFLGEELSARVLVIDNDKQGNASQFFNVNTELSLADLLLNQATTADVIQKTRYSHVDIIPSDMALATACLSILQNTDVEQHKILAKALSSVYEDYDICIIDNAPDINISVLNAMVISDEIIIVTVPDEYSQRGIKEMKTQIELARHYNPNLVYRCLFNKMTGSTTSLFYRGEIAKNHPIFHTNIHYSKDWPNATTQKKLSIFELSPRCVLARDMKSFLSELFH